jgi:hypothetical protein
MFPGESHSHLCASLGVDLRRNRLLPAAPWAGRVAADALPRGQAVRTIAGEFSDQVRYDGCVQYVRTVHCFRGAS